MLARLYEKATQHEIAELMGRTVPAINNRARKLGLRRPLNPGRFTAGAAPWNKGLSFDPGGRSQETRFKKGNRSGRAAKLWVPVGSERIDKEG